MVDLLQEDWVDLLPADPRPWLLQSEEPAARWVTLTELLDVPPDDPAATREREPFLSDPGTGEIIRRLPVWDRDVVATGHNSLTFAPNMLGWLWRMGLRGGDSPVVERMLDQMLEHQDEEGRFQTLGRWRGQSDATWGSLLCDNHGITEVLLKLGRGDDPRTKLAVHRVVADAAETAQGTGWPCRQDPVTRFRGPGRKSDVCPQVTAEALRLLGSLPAVEQPPHVADAAHTLCRVWLERGEIQPYMFGHGKRFKTVKWPPIWYDSYSLVDALSLSLELKPSIRERQLDGGRQECVRALAEIAACLVAYNFGPDGRVIPRSCCRGFESYSWGQKKLPSPTATAVLCSALRRITSLTAEIRSVDVLSLGSSKGGTGRPAPPGR